MHVSGQENKFTCSLLRVWFKAAKAGSVWEGDGSKQGWANLYGKQRAEHEVSSSENIFMRDFISKGHLCGGEPAPGRAGLPLVGADPGVPLKTVCVSPSDPTLRLAAPPPSLPPGIFTLLFDTAKCHQLSDRLEWA